MSMVTEDGNSLVAMDEVITNKNGEFSHTFKVPNGTEAGTYKLKVQANEPVNKTVELDLVIVEEHKPEVKVAFNYTEYTVKVGERIPKNGDLLVTTTGLEDNDIKSIVIISSDENVVSVTQLPVHETENPKRKKAYGEAKKAGDCRITATITDINEKVYTAECKVTVTEAAVNVTSVSLNKDEVSLKIDETETLIATINPSNATNKNITWESSDMEVATVDDSGKVTAVGAGEATITVTTEDGNKTATCKVKVEESIDKLDTEALENSKAIAKTKIESDYTLESYKLLTEALVLPETTQSEIDAKVKAINEAIEGLEQKSEVELTLNFNEIDAIVGKPYPMESGVNLEVVVKGLADEDIKDIVWTSSNSSIATIEGRKNNRYQAYGKGIKTGKAAITVKVIDKNDDEYTAECLVTVKGKEEKIDVTLYYYGDEYTTPIFLLKANNLPEDAYFYKVKVEEKESWIARIGEEAGFGSISIEEVGQAEEVTVQLFHDDRGEKNVKEVQVTPIFDENEF